ncbi:MAG: polyprenol monophosphomannose synthase [Candidatus Omnitrophota bacterium]
MPMVSILIPTYNEKDNITVLIERLQRELGAAAYSNYEILVMDDDSPDKTADCVNALKDPRVRAINRRGKPRGLSNAVLDGFACARGEFFGVMDADLSHPPSAVPAMIRALEAGAAVAVGSRYVSGGGIVNWPWHRVLTSRVSSLLASPLTSVRDATSGFFFVRKGALDGVTLSPLGFKIGLEVFVKAAHGGRVIEVPYVFTDRRYGQSKLGPGVMTCYLRQLLSLARYRISGNRAR